MCGSCFKQFVVIRTHATSHLNLYIMVSSENALPPTHPRALFGTPLPSGKLRKRQYLSLFVDGVKLLMHCGLKIYSSTLCSFLISSPPTPNVSKSVGVGKGSSTGITPDNGDCPSFCPVSFLNDSVTARQKASKSFLFVSSSFYKHEVCGDVL